MGQYHQPGMEEIAPETHLEGDLFAIHNIFLGAAIAPHFGELKGVVDFLPAQRLPDPAAFRPGHSSSAENQGSAIAPASTG